jgi:DNA-binding protein YbaB
LEENVSRGDNTFGFDVDGLRELQREAQKIASGLSKGLDQETRVDGWDGSRTVRVTVDGSGRVVDAEIGLSWRDALGPAELSAAVIEAVDAAAAGRMDAWTRATKMAADDVTEESGGNDPWTAGFDHVGGAGRSGSLRDPAVLHSTQELYYLAMEAIDRLGEVSREMEPVGADVVRGHSPDRFVTVAVEDGRVAAVDFNQSWLKQATAVEITHQLRAAFRAVDLAGPQSVAARTLDVPSIRDLQEAGADPRELLRRLGLG